MGMRSFEWTQLNTRVLHKPENRESLVGDKHPAEATGPAMSKIIALARTEKTTIDNFLNGEYTVHFWGKTQSQYFIQKKF